MSPRRAAHVSVRALPHTCRHADARRGQALTFEIGGDAGGVWSVMRGDDGWTLYVGSAPDPVSRVSTDSDTAWKVFFRALPRERLEDRVQIAGDRRLGAVFFDVAAVMI